LLLAGMLRREVRRRAGVTWALVPAPEHAHALQCSTISLRADATGACGAEGYIIESRRDDRWLRVDICAGSETAFLPALYRFLRELRVTRDADGATVLTCFREEQRIFCSRPDPFESSETYAAASSSVQRLDAARARLAAMGLGVPHQPALSRPAPRPEPMCPATAGNSAAPKSKLPEAPAASAAAAAALTSHCIDTPSQHSRLRSRQLGC